MDDHLTAVREQARQFLLFVDNIGQIRNNPWITENPVRASPTGLGTQCVADWKGTNRVPVYDFPVDGRQLGGRGSSRWPALNKVEEFK